MIAAKVIQPSPVPCALVDIVPLLSASAQPIGWPVQGRASLYCPAAHVAARPVVAVLARPASPSVTPSLYPASVSTASQSVRPGGVAQHLLRSRLLSRHGA